MTQQDIVNELNRMVVGYNINWQMIKYDADRAIMKINAHLGAEYPMMSKIMLSPKHRYVLTVGHVEKPIFPERYILTVVIPFIATEVLARDEEFTTIYNKYAMDFENGLFDMFQNEYNKVPLAFRQDKDVGVFFSADRPEHKLHEDKIKKLPDFTFNVYYHFNFSEYTPMKRFTFDEKKYLYNSTVTLLDSTVSAFFHDIYHYEFKGWSRDLIANTVIYDPGDEINIDGDIHLYAIWERSCILSVDNTGAVIIDPLYIKDIDYLSIPVFVEGNLVKIIPEGFTNGADNLKVITLPPTELEITQGAFTNSHLHELIFPSYDYLRGRPKITIEQDAVAGTSIYNLYIPYSVSVIGANGIKGVPYVQCEVAERPTEWDANFTDAKVEWGVPNG